jgi:2-polyprenyl-6-hydroxyphenyl methylase/3-demethylubiquinone-9 3-methyltransferase
MTVHAASIDNEEVEKFSRMAEEWWDQHGKFKPLHRINPLRLGYISEQASAHLHRPLSELSIIDIGCGGGLLAEPLARLGAQVTGIDASEKNIRIAALHAEQSGVTVDYRTTSIEALAATGVQYDVVISMEVIEHVADVASFMAACCAVVKPGGIILVGTLNRTLKSYAMAIIGAEYVLRWLPRGTHDWSKFLTPSEIDVHFRHHGITLQQMKGMVYQPFKDIWLLSDDIDVNYMLVGVK